MIKTLKTDLNMTSLQIRYNKIKIDAGRIERKGKFWQERVVLCDPWWTWGSREVLENTKTYKWGSNFEVWPIIHSGAPFWSYDHLCQEAFEISRTLSFWLLLQGKGTIVLQLTDASVIAFLHVFDHFE